jgi:hypothetical protein
VFIVFSLIMALLPLGRGHEIRWWALGVAGALMVVRLVVPAWLAPFTRVWLTLGTLLHTALSPVVMSLIFWTTVVPVGVVRRACGKDPLRLKPDPQASTYWIPRRPAGPQPGSMSRQF